MASSGVVLLRGINVGGKRPIAMAALRDVLTDAGFTDVRTYIQSGNVLLGWPGPRGEVEPTVERLIEERFGFSVPVVARTHAQLRSIVRSAPDGFGRSPDEFHSDVVFLKSPLTAARAVTRFGLRAGVDQIWVGNGVVYFSRLSARRTESKMSSVVGTPDYQLMTIRSWSTTIKLLALLDAGG